MEAISNRDTLNFNEVFIDGTKFEAYANKYTFIWKGSIQKRLAKLSDKFAVLKHDVWIQLGLETAAMSDELVYTYLAKEIERTGTRKDKTKTGFISKRKVYTCKSCNRCGLRKECQPYAKIWNASNPKQIETNPAYDALLADNQKRLISAEGIQLRTNRSLQVEGTFGALKEGFQFKRFNHRGKDTVHKTLYILAMGFNLAKLHDRIQSSRINKTLFEIKEVA